MAKKGKKLSLKHKKKLSEAHKGKIPWNKGIRTGFAPWKGKQRSDETKKKISESNKGKSRNKGKDVSHETREKISKALLGRRQSEETKHRKSLALRGRESNRKGVIHTEQSKVKMRIAAKRYSGVNHYAWKGGVTKLQAKIRKSYKYKDWRSKIFIRDKWTCQDCGKKRCYFYAHHKKEFYKIIEENNVKSFTHAMYCQDLWKIDNGVTLCRDCHNKKHPNLNLVKNFL